MSVALKAENVSIRYITGDFKDIGIKEYVVRHLTNNYHVNEFMAVDGVSFELEKGDMLGIIGTNGAGKSTLLKAVAGIMEPTQGKITANGEVAALLELGSGFDGDLTVKENAYLRGAMLGYTKAFMDETYDQIIDFAELREFENRPFKQLSSGMKSRLAFSIASLVKPDILILDEVLSVGDGAFQEKSAKKMREIISQGATTILVSHSLAQIRELCNKVLWLDHGRQVAFGETQEICDIYEEYLQGTESIESLKNGISEKDSASASNISTSPSNAVTEKTPRMLPAQILRSIISCCVLACCIVFFVGKIYYHIPVGTRTNIKLVADVSSGSVTFRGGIADGEWLNPEILIQDATNWSYDTRENVYTAVDSTPLYLQLPVSNDIQLTFSASPSEGTVEIVNGNKMKTLTLKTDAIYPAGQSYLIETEHSHFSKRNVMLSAFAISAVILLLLCFLDRKRSAISSAKPREFWLDCLKVLSAIMIVAIHAVGQMYAKGPSEGAQWTGYLFLNAVTRCAVPLFIMISGILLLGKEISLKKSLKNACRAVVLLICWNVLYLVYSYVDSGSGQSILQGIQRLPVERAPSGHLWYSYLLVWIYLFSPMLSALYRALTNRQRGFFIIITTVIPGILWLYQQLGEFGGQSVLTGYSLYMTPTYMGMMFLGRMLYDNSMHLLKRYAIGAIIVGLCGSIYITSWYCKHTGCVTDIFLFEQNLLIVIYAAGVLSLGSCLQNTVNRCHVVVKRLITALSKVSLGIYFAHCIVLWNIPEFTILGHTVSQLGSPLSIVCISFITYVITGLIALSMKNIPVVRKLVQ